MIALLLLSMADEVAVVAEPPPRWFLAAVVAAVVVMALFILRMAVVSNRRRAQRGACPTCGGGVQASWRLCPACGSARSSAAPATNGARVATPAAAVSSGRAAIEFRTGPLAGQNFFLDADVTTIGSFEGNSVLLKDTGVSRKHAGIRRVDGGYELADLGSTNGVYVNGEKSARRKLVAGDIIRIGTSEALFKG